MKREMKALARDLNTLKKTLTDVKLVESKLPSMGEGTLTSINKIRRGKIGRDNYLHQLPKKAGVEIGRRMFKIL